MLSCGPHVKLQGQVEPTHLQNICSSTWVHLPRIYSRWHIKKCLSCYHLADKLEFQISLLELCRAGQTHLKNIKSSQIIQPASWRSIVAPWFFRERKTAELRIKRCPWEMALIVFFIWITTFLGWPTGGKGRYKMPVGPMIARLMDFKLVGGFNPSEKYASQIGSFPQVGIQIQFFWNHHPDYNMDNWSYNPTYMGPHNSIYNW